MSSEYCCYSHLGYEKTEKQQAVDTVPAVVAVPVADAWHEVLQEEDGHWVAERGVLVAGVGGSYTRDVEGYAVTGPENDKKDCDIERQGS